ncbi:MAG: M15 family metallopeptidase [Treponemataceae bacterium]|nr:M15 family metallopeptidase [Treponemataceae bacterium]
MSYFFNFTTALFKAYPENFVGYGFDLDRNLWFFDLKRGKKSMRYFYVNGRSLPAKKIDDWFSFSPLYKDSYPKKIKEPLEYSKNSLVLVSEISLGKNRRLEKPNSFVLIQNFIFDADNRYRVEKNLVKSSFLGMKITMHKKVLPALKRVEEKIYAEAQNDREVANFINQGHTLSGYNWREVRDTYQRSSHSWGISLDYVPSRLNGKQIYWKWATDIYGNNWVYLPLKKRWIPPEKVISIFESEGFIWGGKWELWDNMHFEYHPDVIYLQEN